MLIDHGYQNLSMRRVAQEAGCSQMAMYRHFESKEALIQHLCLRLYTRFTSGINEKLQKVSTPREKINIFIEDLLDFAVAYPDHYSLMFLTRYIDESVAEERERLTHQFLKGLKPVVREMLPQGSSAATMDARLRQLLCAMHGTAALLVAHPHAYGLTRTKAQRDLEDVAHRLLTQ